MLTYVEKARGIGVLSAHAIRLAEPMEDVPRWKDILTIAVEGYATAVLMRVGIALGLIKGR
jgi:hypothetical protein